MLAYVKSSMDRNRGWGPRFVLHKKSVVSCNELALKNNLRTREGFLRKNIVAVLFFQNCAIHRYT